MVAKTADKPTPAAPEVTLVITPEPTVKLGKTAAPNPFLDAIKALKDAGGEAGASVPVASEDLKDKTTARYNRQLTAAGKELDVTVNRGILPDGKGGFKLAFKVRERIRRTTGESTATNA